MTDQIQARLLRLAALFLFLYALAITFSPAVRLRTWPVDLLWRHWIGWLVWIVMTAFLHHQSAISLPDRDPFILPAGALLTGWGIMTQFRLDTVFGMRQSAWLVIVGIMIILLLRRKISVSILRRYKYLILTGGLILTGLTFFLGTNPLGYGPRLWLGCCGIYLQPSEPLKLFFIIYLSSYLADRKLFLKALNPQTGFRSLKNLTTLVPILAPSLLMTSLALALMLIQRDLGTASIFLFLFACIVYLAVQEIWLLGFSIVSLVISTISGYFLFDVIRLRIDSWLNPWLDPSGRSYQIVQSLIAAANGGLFGRGPGLGNPGLVPISHSDFIFSSISEEMGLLGGVGLIALVALIAHRGLVTALRTQDSFQRLMAVGLTTYLAGQSILIIGGNLKLLPLTGVTLPFVSYGGSSLVTSFFALFALLFISNTVEVTYHRHNTNRSFPGLHAFLLGGLFMVSLALGWWTIYRAPDLLTRTDNARRSIADRSVKRGSLLDRQGQPLVITGGEPGSYERIYLYPDLGVTTGYSHPVYGQSGLEAAADPWLRGMEGYPLPYLWWELSRYGQPPTGLDVRLTIDLQYQQKADELLSDQVGTILVMNATNGDLLAMASHPTFDPNRLDEDWSVLVQDSTAPLVNRVTSGQYPIGPLLTPLLLAKAYEDQLEPKPAQNLGFELETGLMNCALPVEESNTSSRLGAQAAAGCPGLTAALGEQIGGDELLVFLRELGLFKAPDLGLQEWTSPEPESILDAPLGALGLEPILNISPLQAAAAVAALSSNGVRPEPRLVLAYNTPEKDWISHQASGSSEQILEPASIEFVSQLLRIDGTLFWQSTAASANAGDHQPAFTWYLGGTLPDWPGRQVIVVVLLEKNAPDLAVQIGRSLLTELISSPSATAP